MKADQHPKWRRSFAAPKPQQSRLWLPTVGGSVRHGFTEGQIGEIRFTGQVDVN